MEIDPVIAAPALRGAPVDATVAAEYRRARAEEEEEQALPRSDVGFFFHCCRSRVLRGFALDLTAMLKSLFAAISILRLLDTSNMIGCSDAGVNTYPLPMTLAGWYVREQCAPRMNIDRIKSIFTAFVIANQITFLLTSLIRHTNPRKILSRSKSARYALASFLGLCSFLFGLCKLFVITSIPATTGYIPSFPCKKPEAIFDNPNMCSDLQILAGEDYQKNPVWYSCAHSCFVSIPPEIYLLSITFLLTWLYSCFMIDGIINSQNYDGYVADMILSQTKREDDDRAAVVAAAASDEVSSPAQMESEDEMSPPRKSASFSSSSSSHISSSSINADNSSYASIDKGHAVAPASIRLQHSRTDLPRSVSGSSNTSELRERLLPYMAGQPQSSSSHYPLLPVRSSAAAATEGEDVFSMSESDLPANDGYISSLPPSVAARYAISKARALTSKEVLLSTIEARYRQQLRKKLQNRMICYRYLRDISTLVKFMITTVSICLILYNYSNTIIRCDRTSDAAHDEATGLTPQTVADRCQPHLTTALPSFLFTLTGAFTCVLFVAVIILEKRVLLPSHSGWISVSTLVLVLLCFAIQLYFMNAVETQRVEFGCFHSYPVTNTSFVLQEYSSCPMWNGNLTANGNIWPEPIWCHDRCYVSLGTSTYTLFASLVLSIVYMANVVWEYRRLAKYIAIPKKGLDLDRITPSTHRNADGSGGPSKLETKEHLMHIIDSL